MTSISTSSKIEEARIREAYRKRQGTALYSWFSPGHLFLIRAEEQFAKEPVKRVEMEVKQNGRYIIYNRAISLALDREPRS